MKASIKWREDYCEDSDTWTTTERALDEAIFESLDKQKCESAELDNIRFRAAARPNVGMLFGCPCIVKPLVLKVKL